jgi:hypothetical protein
MLAQTGMKMWVNLQIGSVSRTSALASLVLALFAPESQDFLQACDHWRGQNGLGCGRNQRWPSLTAEQGQYRAALHDGIGHQITAEHQLATAGGVAGQLTLDFTREAKAAAIGHHAGETSQVCAAFAIAADQNHPGIGLFIALPSKNCLAVVLAVARAAEAVAASGGKITRQRSKLVIVRQLHAETAIGEWLGIIDSAKAAVDFALAINIEGGIDGFTVVDGDFWP